MAARQCSSDFHVFAPEDRPLTRRAATHMCGQSKGIKKTIEPPPPFENCTAAPLLPVRSRYSAAPVAAAVCSSRGCRSAPLRCSIDRRRPRLRRIRTMSRSKSRCGGIRAHGRAARARTRDRCATAAGRSRTPRDAAVCDRCARLRWRSLVWGRRWRDFSSRLCAPAQWMRSRTSSLLSERTGRIATSRSRAAGCSTSSASARRARMPCFNAEQSAQLSRRCATTPPMSRSQTTDVASCATACSRPKMWCARALSRADPVLS